MEDKITYFTVLDTLKEKLKAIEATDSVAERLRLLGLLFEIDKVKGYFFNEVEKAATLTRLNIDNDVNYESWTKPSNWVPSLWLSQQKKESEKSELKKAWLTSGVGYDIPTLMGFAGYLPNSIDEGNYCNEVASDSIFNMLNILTGKYANVVFIQYMIYQSLAHLGTILTRLHERLHGKRSDYELKCFGSNLYKQFLLVQGQSVQSDFEKLLNNHMGDVSKEWLEDQLINHLVILCQSKFMEQKIQDTTRVAANSANVLYQLDDIPSSKVKKFYCALDWFCTFECGYFYFEDKEGVVAEYLRKNQRLIPIEEQSAFFKFRRMSELIKAKIIEIGEPIKDIFPVSFAFSNSNIEPRYDYHKVYSTLYTLVENDKLITAKWHWYIVYLVLNSKHWLSSPTATKFIEDIRSTFQSVSNNPVFSPNDENFKKVDSYYKEQVFSLWNSRDPQAPSSCEEAINIAKIINSTFGREFLKSST